MNFAVNLILILTQCGLYHTALTNRWEVPEGRIVGGHEAVPHSHPYLVSLQMRLLWARAHICGGSLLNERWILTAGHCVKGSWLIRWLPLDAVVGTHDVDNFGPTAQVATIDKRIPHPHYNGDIGPNDIAMLKTKTPFTFTKQIQPIRLPVDYKIYDQSLTLAGWGVLRTTFFVPDMPSKLQEVDVTYISPDDCYQAIEAIRDDDENNPLDKDTNICTGPTTGGIAACSGDSGGPLVQYISNSIEETNNDLLEEVTQENEDSYLENYKQANDKSNKESNTRNKDKEQVAEVIGIVSWGATPCGEEGAPTVYTRVSRYIDFINQHINT